MCKHFHSQCTTHTQPSVSESESKSPPLFFYLCVSQSQVLNPSTATTMDCKSLSTQFPIKVPPQNFNNPWTKMFLKMPSLQTFLSKVLLIEFVLIGNKILWIILILYSSKWFSPVLVAPIKVLCSQRCQEWKEKFEPLGLKCHELTGDTDVDDYFLLQTVNILCTTPVSWIGKVYLKFIWVKTGFGSL